ncbi:MAG TPA: SRPBCC family protein [Ktedonobacteraceae bacterium]
MVNVETSIIIHRPIEEVFAYLSDLRNASQWQSGVVEVRLAATWSTNRRSRDTTKGNCYGKSR